MLDWAVFAGLGEHKAHAVDAVNGDRHRDNGERRLSRCMQRVAQ
jgi:hypothetical protein